MTERQQGAVFSGWAFSPSRCGKTNGTDRSKKGTTTTMTTKNKKKSGYKGTKRNTQQPQNPPSRKRNWQTSSNKETSSRTKRCTKRHRKHESTSHKGKAATNRSKVPVTTTNTLPTPPSPLPPSLPSPRRLFWHNGYHDIPPTTETTLLPALLRYGSTERGMMKTQPPTRITKIRKLCHKHNIQLEQALSLRRHHMKLLNPDIQSMAQLGLGSSENIRRSADLFENAVLAYLRTCGVPFRTEEDQKRGFWKTCQPGDKMPPTPDFRLDGPVTLVSGRCAAGADGVSVERSSDTDGERTIHWIEAKMFYGASSIPHATNNAVGSIRKTAVKYVKHYGPGAFVFSYGCGSKLKQELMAMGISVLDSYPLDLSKMEEHQKRWCANRKGEILP